MTTSGGAPVAGGSAIDSVGNRSGWVTSAKGAPLAEVVSVFASTGLSTLAVPGKMTLTTVSRPAGGG
jgi:hypothetical protein